ncbi:hypothetical protein ABT099_23490 [Streptomyces prasinus]|uniref:hypothetical protein n=1 Tax=Streptomyces prasinus TaxID=67345 RepID=UPI0033180802
MTEPVIPLSEEVAEKEAQRLIGDAYRPTAFRDDSPLPAVGTAPPVPQPGRPPMSQRATDISTMMLAAGVASMPVGGSVSLVLYTLGHVDPVSLAIGATAPVALVLAIGGLLRSLRGIHTEHHHHYTGIVTQTTVNAKSTGVWARTDNRR